MIKRRRIAKHPNHSYINVTPQVDTNEECLEDPLAEKNLNMEQTSSTNSDCEDFLGFEACDIKSEIVDAKTGEVFVVFQEAEHDENHLNQVDENEVDGNELDGNQADGNQADGNQADGNQAHGDQADGNQLIDEDLIIVENDVEIIEIDDDDDDDGCEITPPPLPSQSQSRQLLSINELRQMVYTKHPLIEFRKPNLNWKSDQFRFIYINGCKQNACICTKCLALFDELNIDSIVRHARCIPTSNVSPIAKRLSINEKTNKLENVEQCVSLKLSGDSYGIPYIQTVAACIDLRTSTMFQGKGFLNFANFLIKTGATICSQYEPQYDELCNFSNQWKDIQQSKIRSILNATDQDFSFSCDIWEDLFGRKTNIVLELHYLDLNFLRHRIVIGVKSINDTNVDDKSIYEQIIKILKTYSSEENGVEFLQKAITFVTLGKLQIPSKESTCFQSACGIINDVATEILNEKRLGVQEMCTQMVALLNLVSSEFFFEFDTRKWGNIYELMKMFKDKKTLIMSQNITTMYPNEEPITQLLKPFQTAVKELSDPKNNVTKVFVCYKILANHLAPHPSDKEILQVVKTKALTNLNKAFANSHFYQVCMFLDPFNRSYYDSFEAETIDDIQSKVDALINPYSKTKQNGCVENDLLDYMDDNVTAQQNEIDLFLQFQVSSNDVFEYWRDSVQMNELKKLARKYFTIPTYASLSECASNKDVTKFLTNRSNLEIRDLETMLMMNSFQLTESSINLDRNK